MVMLCYSVCRLQYQLEIGSPVTEYLLTCNPIISFSLFKVLKLRLMKKKKAEDEEDEEAKRSLV